MALHKNRFLASAAISVVMASGIYPAYAADWSGGVSQDWSNAGNWGDGVVPGTTDAVTIRTNSHVSLTSPATVRSLFVNSNDGAFLDISDSGRLNVGSLIAGYDPGQKGSITVSGANAAVTSSFLTTGFGGDGDVSVSNGASFSTSAAILAQQANTVSNLTIDGLNTKWTGGMSGTTIGSSGQANFIVTGGAQAKDYAVNIGYNGTAIGRAAIDGAGTTWDVTGGSLTIGNMGTGHTTVSNGAKVTTANTVMLGSSSGGNGTLNLSGKDSELTSNNYLSAGYMGTGIINLTDGAALNVKETILGWTAPAKGVINMSGAETRWDSTFIQIGVYGEGAANITDGATIRTTSNDFGIIVAQQAGSKGTLEMSGDGTHWDGASLQVGMFGEGTANIKDGATIKTTSSNAGVVVGQQAGSKGTLNMSGRGTAWDGANLQVGVYGEGTANISDGATIKTTSTNAGVLIGRLAGSKGTLNMSGDGTRWEGSYFQIGVSGDGSATISDDATIRIVGDESGVIIAQNAGSKGTLNIGSATGETAKAAGNITAPYLYLGSGTAKLVFNHTDTDYTFSPFLSGGGSVDHLAGFTTFSGNSAAYAGTTNVSGGTAMVTGALGGVVNVLDDGVFGGTGTVGRSGSVVSIGNGGTLSPGLSNSIGSLAVAGNLSFATGSTYVAQILGNSSDSIAVADGVVSIDNGSALKIALLGPATAKNYTLMTASNITGSFSNIDWGGLSGYDISYDNGAVALSHFTESLPIGLNPSAVASVLQSAGTPPELLNEIMSRPPEQRGEIIQQISGETHSEVQTAFIQTTRAVNNTVGGRIRAVTDGVAAPSIPALGYAESKQKTTDPRFAAFEKKAKDFDIGRFSVWGNGFGSWGKVDGLGGSPDTKLASGGMLIGGDALVTDDWRVGIFGGYSRSSFDTVGTSGDSSNYHAGVYAGTRWGDVSFRTGANYTWHDVDTTRLVSALGETLKGNYDSGSVNVFGELSYRVDFAPTSFEPFVSLAHTRLKTDGFTETGGLSALSVEGDRINTTFTTLGLRASADVDIGVVPSVIRGSVGWLHAFGDIDPTTTARFSAGDSFTVSSTPLDKNSALVQAGMDFTLSPISTLGLSYTGQFSETAYEHGANAKFQIRF